MNESLQQALKLRREGELIESNKLLVKLAEQHPPDASLQYECGWSFDILGGEEEGIITNMSSISVWTGSRRGVRTHNSVRCIVSGAGFRTRRTS